MIESYNSITRADRSCPDELVYQELVAAFGDPHELAETVQPVVPPGVRRYRGRAPGWRICCSRCGMSAPASDVGITRLGAASIEKYVGGWCTNCRGPRWYRLIKDLDQVTLMPALGVSSLPGDLRSATHRPWTTVFSILGLVAASLTIGFGTILLIRHWILLT